MKTEERAEVRKQPRQWAVEKGLLKLHEDGRVNYRRHTPWEYEATNRLKRWPDPALDPTFVITASEFDAAILEMHAASTPKSTAR